MSVFISFSHVTFCTLTFPTTDCWKVGTVFRWWCIWENLPLNSWSLTQTTQRWDPASITNYNTNMVNKYCHDWTRYYRKTVKKWRELLPCVLYKTNCACLFGGNTSTTITYSHYYHYSKRRVWIHTNSHNIADYY